MASNTLRRLLPVTADFQQFRANPRADFVAGLSVAVVALPLALAFGVGSGVGAAAGISTAVIAGLLAAIFGGSRVQVSGPTGAMTVVLVPICAQFGADAVFAVGLLAGLILLVMALSGAAHGMRFIPISVIEGFTLGIALLIGLQQVPVALGLKPESPSVVRSAIDAVTSGLIHINFAALSIAVGSMVFIMLARHIHASLPAGIIAVGIATAISWGLKLDVPVVGDIPRSISWHGLPSFANLPLESLIIPALSVAGLAAIEGLLCASVADAMADLPPHNSHQELFGQSIANLAAPLFGGVPATAAIARTAVNVRSGAASRLAAITHSIVLFVFVALGASLVAHIPLSVLAGVLIATASRMVEIKKLRAFISETPHHGVIVGMTAIATLFLDLVEAVLIGLVVAGAISFIQDRRHREEHESEVTQVQVALEHILHTDDEGLR